MSPLTAPRAEPRTELIMTLISRMTLATINSNHVARIQDLEGDPVVVSRLREIGFVRGEDVCVRGRAPFGDPILVELRGAIIALRKAEAACVRL